MAGSGFASPTSPEITRSVQSTSTPNCSVIRVSRSGAALLSKPTRTPAAASAFASSMFGWCSLIGREYHSSKSSSARSPQCSASDAIAAARQTERSLMRPVCSARHSSVP